MSTRSVIARPSGDGFEGRYAHSDGYPTCRGRQLWAAFWELHHLKSHLDAAGVAEELRRYAIREGVSGYWSAFMTPGEAILHQLQRSVPCYCSGDEADCALCHGSGQMPSTWRQGFVLDEIDSWVKSWEDNLGTQWAYVIADHALMVFHWERQAAPRWVFDSECRWDEPEPDWLGIEANAEEAFL